MKGSFEFEQRMIFGIIIFILIAAILLRVSTSPECDALANETARELRDAINEVANENFPSWIGNTPPSDEYKEYFKPVMIRLCEKNVGISGAAFSVAIPTYQIFYETFPEASTFSAWDESYPFSGGAANALINYGVLKYGGKGIKVIKATVKFAKNTIKYGLKNILKLSSISKFIQEARSRGILKALLRKPEVNSEEISLAFTQFLSQEFKTYAKTSDHKLFQDSLKETENSIKKFKESGIVKDLFVDTPEGKKLLVTRENIDTFKTIYDFADLETQKILDQYFYIPSKWNKIENFKWKIFNVKQISGKIWRGSLLGKATSNLRNKYYNLRKSVYNFFGREIQDTDALQTARNYKIKCYLNPSECRKMLKEIWNDDIESIMSQITGKKVKKETFSDADMFKFMEEHEKWIILSEKKIVFTSDQSEIINEQIKKFYENKINELEKETIELDKFLDSLENPPDELVSDFRKNLPESVQLSDEAIKDILKVSINEVDLKNSEYAFKIGKIGAAYPGPIPWSKNPLKFALYDLKDKGITSDKYIYILSKYQKIEEKSQFFSRKIVDPSDLQKLAEKKVKGYFFVKVGRIAPTAIFASKYGPAAPLIPGSAYFSRVVEDQLSGYCVEGSICFTSGHNIYSYLVNDEAKKYAIRLWRPKPSVDQRLPIFIQTGWFYASVEENPRFYIVSPCLGYAKVWKSGGNIFISFDIDEKTGQIKKCNILDKEGKVVEKPNYCYAAFNDVWGADLNNLENVGGGNPWINNGAIFGHIAGILGGCVASGPYYKQCVQIATMVDEIALSTVSTIAATQKDLNWGYWTYYKAADAIDLLDIAGSLGAKSAIKTLSKIQEYAPDLSVYIQTLGDVTMAWPKRGIFDKAQILDENDIYRSQGQCIWESK